MNEIKFYGLHNSTGEPKYFGNLGNDKYIVARWGELTVVVGITGLMGTPYKSKLRPHWQEFKGIPSFVDLERLNLVFEHKENNGKQTIPDLDRHIILYAKDWYKITDTIEDLRVIVGKFVMIDPQYIKIDDIFQWVVNIVEEYCGQKEIAKQFRQMFKRFGEWEMKDVTLLYIIQKLLDDSLAQLVVKADGIDIKLGIPDPAVLPLKEK